MLLRRVTYSSKQRMTQKRPHSDRDRTSSGRKCRRMFQAEIRDPKWKIRELRWGGGAAGRGGRGAGGAVKENLGVSVEEAV